MVWTRRGTHRRRVARYSTWVTFQQVRATASGGFAATYRFKLGGHHVYQFQAVAPAEGQFQNATGRSHAVSVTES